MICALQEVRNELHDFSFKKTEMERKKETKKKTGTNTKTANRQNMFNVQARTPYDPQCLLEKFPEPWTLNEMRKRYCT